MLFLENACSVETFILEQLADTSSQTHQLQLIVARNSQRFIDSKPWNKIIQQHGTTRNEFGRCNPDLGI